MPYHQLAKRRTSPKKLLRIDLEELCLDLVDLSHEEKQAAPSSELDVLLDAFQDLDVSLAIDGHEYRSVETLLKLDLDTNILPSARRTRAVDRAIRLCRECGLTTFRDILWYNDSLRQSAKLSKLPVCLTAMSYKLDDWTPRKCQPDVTLERWQRAWQALDIAWPVIKSGLSQECRSVLLERRWESPPTEANWFEFMYCDGIFSGMEPVLCYQDNNNEDVSVILKLPRECFGERISEVETCQSESPALTYSKTELSDSEEVSCLSVEHGLLLSQETDTDSECSYSEYTRSSD